MRRLGVVGVAVVAVCVAALAYLRMPTYGSVPQPTASSSTWVPVRMTPGALSEQAIAQLVSRPISRPSECTPSPLTRGPVAFGGGAPALSAPSAIYASIDGHYAGYLVVRGERLSDGALLRFEIEGSQLYVGEAGRPLENPYGFPEIVLTAPDFRPLNGTVNSWFKVIVPGPGCYVLQIDGFDVLQKMDFAV